MSWLFGLIGWGGAGALLVAVLAFGWVASKKVLLILGGIVAAALLAWGARGYVQASALRKDVAAAQAALTVTTGERDKARTERAAALDAAETCSASVAALKTEADKREKDATPARQQAARTAHTNQQRAAAILAAPPKVPGDDAASAQAQIDAWIAEKGTQ